MYPFYNYRVFFFLFILFQEISRLSPFNIIYQLYVLSVTLCQFQNVIFNLTWSGKVNILNTVLNDLHSLGKVLFLSIFFIPKFPVFWLKCKESFFASNNRKMFGVRKTWAAGMMLTWALGMTLPSKLTHLGTVLLAGTEKNAIVLRYTALSATPGYWIRATEIMQFQRHAVFTEVCH